MTFDLQLIKLKNYETIDEMETIGLFSAAGSIKPLLDTKN